MRTLHGHSKQSGRSGVGLVAFLQTKHAHLYFELIHVGVDIKTSKPGLLRKSSHHWTDIISMLTKVNIPCTSHFCSLNRHNSFTPTSMLTIAGQRVSSVNVTNQTFIMKRRPVAPGWRVLRISVAIYMYQSRPFHMNSHGPVLSFMSTYEFWCIGTLVNLYWIP